MENQNKKSLSYKIQKNPFLIGAGLIIAIIVLIAVFSVSSAFRKKIDEKNTQPATEVSTTVIETEQPEVTKEDKTVNVEGLKTYVDDVRETSSDYEENRVALNFKFKDKPAVLKAFSVNAESMIDDSVSFVFYIGGETVSCPGEYYLSNDNVTVSFYLYDIADIKNALSLTDGLNINYNNILTSKPFNIVLTDIKTGEARTFAGTHSKKYEETKKNKTVPVSMYVKGIDRVEVTETKEFIWLDIYYSNESTYKSLNYKFENNFIGFKFEYGKKMYDTLFSTTEYDDLKMIRCKFDSYALEQVKEMSGNSDYTINSLFSGGITVFASNYDKTTELFSK